MSEIILKKDGRTISVSNQIEADLFIKHYGWVSKVDTTVVKEKTTKAVKEA